jgi:hypothetical protein
MTRTLRLHPRLATLLALLAPAAFFAANATTATADGTCTTPSLEQVTANADGSTTTAPVVVGSAQATVCFSVQAGAAGTLRVDAVYQDTAGADQIVPLGAIGAPATDAATVTLSADGLPAAEDAATPIVLRFTAVDGSNWDIGDIHIDPYGKG